MPWKVYEYVGLDGVGEITGWDLQKPHKAKLMQKIRMLAAFGADLPPGLLAGPGIGGQGHIYKLRVRSNVEMRPMLSKGPHDNNAEFTLLARAVERDGQPEPANASETAEARRQEVLANRHRRRELL